MMRAPGRTGRSNVALSVACRRHAGAGELRRREGGALIGFHPHRRREVARRGQKSRDARRAAV